MRFFRFKNHKKLMVLFTSLLCGNAYASTSLTVSGHAAATGQVTSKVPAIDNGYLGIRVPVGFTLEAAPTDSIHVYLGLDYAYHHFPQMGSMLGQTSATTSPDGSSTPMPFSNSINVNTPYGGNIDSLAVTSAYFTFQTPLGLFQAGRMPRHWGLGMWQNSEWSPTTGSITTSDALAFTTSISLFDASIFYEQYGSALLGKSTDGNATAYTIEVRLKTDKVDPPSSGVSREFGFHYSYFMHDLSKTNLTIIDGYGKLYFQKFFAGAELLFPTGSTQNPNYQAFGGNPKCPDQNDFITCSSQDISSVAGLLKFKWEVAGDENSSIASLEAQDHYVATKDRQTSQTLGAWIGYASGGSNQFNSSGENKDITAIMMNANIQPSFLMFNNNLPAINGMPTGSVTNTTFMRLNYLFETSGFGSIEPSLSYARLNKLNTNYNASTDICSNPVSIDASKSINSVCVGGNPNLGVELDVSYKYTTISHIQFSADVGYWVVGDAWKLYGNGTPSGVYGARISTSTEF